MTSLGLQMRRLGRHSAVYGLGGIVSRVLAVFLLPLYTRYLTTSDLGAVGLVVALSAVVVTILRAGISSAFFRFYFDSTDAGAAAARRPHLVLVHDGERDVRARRGRPPRRAAGRPARPRRPEPRPRRLRRRVGADELRAADLPLPRRGALDRIRVREPGQHRRHDRRHDSARRRLGAGRARRHRRELHRHAVRLSRTARRPPGAARAPVLAAAAPRDEPLRRSRSSPPRSP